MLLASSLHNKWWLVSGCMRKKHSCFAHLEAKKRCWHVANLLVCLLDFFVTLRSTRCSRPPLLTTYSAMPSILDTHDRSDISTIIVELKWCDEIFQTLQNRKCIRYLLPQEAHSRQSFDDFVRAATSTLMKQSFTIFCSLEKTFADFLKKNQWFLLASRLLGGSSAWTE